jgi:hypothetical protein
MSGPEGWLANTRHPPISGWGNFDKDEWELYHLAQDRAQTTNVAAEHPQLLEELKGLWSYYAGVYKGLPLDDRTTLEIISSPRPQPTKPRDRYVYYPNTSDVPESVAVNVRRRSFTIAAGAVIEREDAQSVLFAHGGVAGGHSLFVRDGRLRYTYNWLGERIQDVVSDAPITTGKHVFTAEFRKTGDDEGTNSSIGTHTLYVDDDPVGKSEIWTPGFFALTGDGLCVGRDGNSPVSPDYRSPFPFTGGTIDRVIVDVSGDQYVDHEKEVQAYLARD